MIEVVHAKVQFLGIDLELAHLFFSQVKALQLFP